MLELLWTSGAEVEPQAMWVTVYLAVMVGIIAAITLVSVPALLFSRCPGCRARNALDADVCRKCGAPLPKTDQVD